MVVQMAVLAEQWPQLRPCLEPPSQLAQLQQLLCLRGKYGYQHVNCSWQVLLCWALTAMTSRGFEAR